MEEVEQIAYKREYEMSYLLTAEDGIAEITNALFAAQMEAKTTSPASSIKLAYPIKNHQSAYFGYSVFSGAPANVTELKKSLAHNSKVLRLLIITPPIKVVNREEARVNGMERKRTEQAPKREEAPAPRAIEPQILSNEGLEKKLEEILK